MTDDKQAELLLDHYRDTFQLTGEHWKTRNRLFILVLIALTLMLFQLTSPNVLERLANSYIRKQVEPEAAAEVGTTDNKSIATQNPSPTSPISSLAQQQEAKRDLVDFRFITSVLWFVLAYLLVQYCQRSIVVDRQYIYLSELETKLNALLGPASVTREGESYLKDRPKFLKHVRYLYGPVFLSLLALVVIAKMIQEGHSFCRERSMLDRGGMIAAISFGLIDFVIALVIGYYTVLYSRWLLRTK
jgi:hypothetical protein